MFVSGFTIIRNATKFGYPVVEAITSILPVCDEFVVNVGQSDDDTLDLVKSISSPKLKIFERTWDLSLRKGGQLISVETNHALDECQGDWCFYIQADEVLHEKYLQIVRDEMEQHLDNPDVEGLQFRYKHFYGSYDYYQDNYRRWYIKECRIIRRHPDIISWGDGMDFRHRDGKKLKLKRIDAEIYHYGWVRPPNIMIEKTRGFHSLWYNDEELARIMERFNQPYNELGHLKRFTETHPLVMKQRIANSKWDFDPKIEEQPHDIIRHVLIFLQPLTKRIKRFLRLISKNQNS